MKKADVVIQAGHQGGYRNHGSGRVASGGTAGLTIPEQQLTPLVADGAAALLRARGVDVARVSAFYDDTYQCKLAIAVHFDGSGTPCASGASIGYPTGSPPGSNKPTADLWRQVYGKVWPFKWMRDNFTTNLSGYYGYRWTSTNIAELVLEFGEITCKEQNDWLVPRVQDGTLSRVLASFILQALGMPPLEDGSADQIAELKKQLAALKQELEKAQNKLHLIQEITKE